jgi:hypothetical protein
MWDLHVHSPLSALANNFPTKNGNPDWEQYLSAIEKIKDLRAIGITDYFSVEGYREVLNFKKAGRLGNLELILPNIELRLNNLVYRTRTNQNRPED